MTSRAFKFEGDQLSLLYGHVDALDNLGIACVATSTGIECSYPKEYLRKAFTYTSMRHERARVLKLWRSELSEHRSSSTIRNAWFEQKLVFNVTVVKRNGKANNKFILFFRDISEAHGGGHSLHRLSSIFDLNGVKEDFLPSIAKAVKLELNRHNW
jgi:hypothetical protein